jgi:hypothetical protein
MREAVNLPHLLYCRSNERDGRLGGEKFVEGLSTVWVLAVGDVETGEAHAGLGT